MQKYLLAMAALALCTAEAPPPAPVPAPEEIDWSVQVATLTYPDATSIRIAAAGDYGCEMTFLADAKKPDLVIYRTNDPVQVVTVLPPPAWLEDGETQMLTLGMQGDKGLFFIKANFSRVQDPNRGPVLRTQDMGNVPEHLTGVTALLVGSPRKERKSIVFSLTGDEAESAVGLMDLCLAWIGRHNPDNAAPVPKG